MPDRSAIVGALKCHMGGVNAGVVLHEDLVIAVHGKENIDSSRIGRMVEIRKPDRLPGGRPHFGIG